jgi:phosphotriesterase-related protein
VTRLITTLGDFPAEELGIILPHEHVFVDLRTWDQPGYGEGDADDVVRLMTPEIAAVQEQGVTAIVEPGPVGVGRRVDILKAVSMASGMPLVVPTGVYREPWLTPWAHEATEDALCDWMVAELTDGVEATGVRAGFIKVGATDDGVTPAEAKVLRAAARASAQTGAAIGSHTVRGDVARSQVEIIEGAGGDASRFIWIHAHVEPDVSIHHELARRGVWLEYDGIGNPADDARFIDLIQQGLAAGFGVQLLLSHDRGWYDPAQPGGGIPQPYTYLIDHFLPKLADAGTEQATIEQLTRTNPFRAFAR